LQGIGLESHAGIMGFQCGICKALVSLTTKASLCDVILPRFLLIGIKAFLHVSPLQMSGAGGDAKITIFT